jgi:hypothetical protein
VDQAEEHLHRGRLSRAVRPEEAEDLALVDRQVEMVNYGLVLVRLDKLSGLNDDLAHFRSLCPRITFYGILLINLMSLSPLFSVPVVSTRKH